MKIQPVALTFLLLASLAPVAGARCVAGARRARKSLVLIRTGVIANRDSERTYMFRARRGQTIRAFVDSKTPGFYPLLFITSPSGRNLTQDKNTSYSARLKETGVYQVRAGVNLMATETTSGAYYLSIRVR